MNLISLQYTITKEDYAAYYNYAMWSSPDRKKKRIYAILRQLGSAAFFLGIYYYSFRNSYSTNTLLVAVAVFLVISILSIFSTKNTLDKQLDEFIQNPDNANIFSDTFLTATDTDLKLQSEYFETKALWKAIVNKAETDSHYFLYINAVQAFIIPKRCFKNNEEKNAFDRILSRTLSLDAQIKEDIKNASK
jgi:hypothetical protein